MKRRSPVNPGKHPRIERLNRMLGLYATCSVFQVIVKKRSVTMEPVQSSPLVSTHAEIAHHAAVLVLQIVAVVHEQARFGGSQLNADPLAREHENGVLKAA